MNRRFEEKAAAAIQAYQMAPQNGRIIVGFSGGADSTALLHYLAGRYPGAVTAAHINHCLRGAESDRDEQFAREFCAARDIPLAVKRTDVAALAKRRRQSVEECGRMVRYAFFDTLLEGEGDRIATAHTLSDSAETMLFHLARGTGSRGLCGIPPVRGRIIRPLIGVTRREVEDYCRRQGLSYVEDSTNRSGDFARNKIRRQVVPALEGINPAFLQSAARLARQMAEQEAALSLLGRQALAAAARPGGFEIAVLRQYPKAAVLQGLLETLRERGAGGAVTDGKMQRIYDCVLRGRGGVTVCGGLEVRAEQGILLFAVPGKPAPDWEVPFLAPQTFRNGGKEVIVSEISLQSCKINENISISLFHNLVDYDTIQNGVVWRTRRVGDIFRPPKRNGSKPLKKLLQESRVPPSRRDALLLLADGATILWAEGFGAAEGFGVTAGTRRAVEITVKEGTANADGN